MNVKYSRHFQKQYKKAPGKIRKAVKVRIKLFLRNPIDSILNNHSLVGNLKGYKSINITGDWRAVYLVRTDENGNQVAYFEALGTHSQLY